MLNPRNIRVFAVKETTPGTLAWPAAANSLILAGNPKLSQQPGYTPSNEMRGGLNLKNEIQDKLPAGTLSLTLALRLSGVTANQVNAPQGDVLLEALMGEKLDFSAEVGVGGIDNAVTIIPVANVVQVSGSQIPEKGLVLLDDGLGGTELVYYDGVTRDANGNVTALISCTRGYGGTTAQAFAAAEAITFVGICFGQKLGRITFSLWVLQDTKLEWAAGCTLNSLKITLSNKGEQQLEFSGGFMTRGWAGKATLASGTASSAVLTLGAGEAKHYRVGSRIWNQTKNVSNAGAGYQVLAVDEGSNQITINTNVTWSANDVLLPYLPADAEIGEVVEARNTQVRVNSIAKKPTAGSLHIDAPVKYIEEEITQDPISEFTEGMRNIGGNLDLIMRNSDLQLFADAQANGKTPFVVVFGDGALGSNLAIEMPACRFKMPETDAQDETIKLSQEFTATDPDGRLEASCFLHLY